MFRTQISLGDDERRALDAETKRTGHSMSSLIRAAVTATYGAPAATESEIAAVTAAFGTWTGRAEDGSDFVDRLRSGRRLDRDA